MISVSSFSHEAVRAYVYCPSELLEVTVSRVRIDTYALHRYNI